MIVELHPDFKKKFKKRIAPHPKLKRQFENRINIFRQNQHYPLLKNHALTGKKRGYYSFSITGDIRVVYQKTSSGRIILFDIGTHNQVY